MNSGTVAILSNPDRRTGQIDPALTTGVVERLIQSGETLFVIARDEYGDGNFYPVLWEFNRQRGFLTDNPNVIIAGDPILIPTLDELTGTAQQSLASPPQGEFVQTFLDLEIRPDTRVAVAPTPEEDRILGLTKFQLGAALTLTGVGITAIVLSRKKKKKR